MKIVDMTIKDVLNKASKCMEGFVKPFELTFLRRKVHGNYTGYYEDSLHKRVEALYSGKALNSNESYYTSRSDLNKAVMNASKVAENTIELGKELYALGLDVNEIFIEKSTFANDKYPIPANGHIKISPRVKDFKYLDFVLKGGLLEKYNILIEQMTSSRNSITYVIGARSSRIHSEDAKGYSTLDSMIKQYDYAFGGYEDVYSVELNAQIGDSNIRIYSNLEKKWKNKYYGDVGPFIDIQDIFEREYLKRK